MLLVGILLAFLLARWGPYVLGRALSAYLQTAVTVREVRGGWWSGLTVYQLSVTGDDRNGTWWGDRLGFRSDGLAAKLRDVVARRTPTPYNLLVEEERR